MAGLLELIGDQAVAELRVIGVDVVGDVDQVRLLHITIADRGRAPLVEGLLAEAQHPAGHRYRDPGIGKVKDQRVHHFGRACPILRFACER